jgi:hypothetical protein
VGVTLRILRRVLLPQWLMRPLSRGARRLAQRLAIVLLIAGGALFLFWLWRDATYTWPSRRVVQRVAEAAGLEACTRDDLLASLRQHGFTTLSAGMTREAVRRVLAQADYREEPSRSREVYYFDFLRDHEYAFYLDYDTADRLVALSWEFDFFWRRPAEPLAIRPPDD